MHGPPTYGSFGNKGAFVPLTKEEDGDVDAERRIGKLGSLIILHTSSSLPRKCVAKYLNPYYHT